MSNNRQTLTGQVGIYRKGQSQYTCELKVGEKTFNWYDWNRIPKCFKDLFVGNNHNYAEIVVSIHENGSFPRNVVLIKYL